MSLRRRSALVLLPLVSATALAGCGGDSAPAPASPSASSAAGVAVKGAFGEKPSLTVPATAAPKALTTDVLTAGSGATAAKGDLVVVNYLGQTWEPKEGKPNVFDNSFDKKKAFGFPLGGGQVIKGWDQALEGKKVGSRVLLTIPPDLAYGAEKNGSNELGGQTLLFVVDVVNTIGKDASAKGSAVTPTAAGLPKISSESGKKPAITSVAGIAVPAKPLSGLLLKGEGEKIDPTKTLAMQIVQTDTATGKQTQETWGKGLTSAPAETVLGTVSALQGATIGSRAVVVTPKGATDGSPSAVLVVDVVGQF